MEIKIIIIITHKNAHEMRWRGKFDNIQMQQDNIARFWQKLNNIMHMEGKWNVFDIVRATLMFCLR